MKNKSGKIKVISRSIAFKGYVRGIEKIRYELPDRREQDYYIKFEGRAVILVALTKTKRVIMLESFAPGLGRIGPNLPGGYMNKGESFIATAKRELMEETGYAGKLRYIGPCADDSYSKINHWCVVATECELVGTQKLDKNEFIKVKTVSVAAFRKILKSGKMPNTKIGYFGLDHLGLF